jgi:hypothetical protein
MGARPGNKYKPEFSPDNTSLKWVTEVLPSLGGAGGAPYGSATVHDCTLGPGEILWLGHDWWHATLNIGDTVFVSTFI